MIHTLTHIYTHTQFLWNTWNWDISCEAANSTLNFWYRIYPWNAPRISYPDKSDKYFYYFVNARIFYVTPQCWCALGFVVLFLVFWCVFFLSCFSVFFSFFLCLYFVYHAVPLVQVLSWLVGRRYTLFHALAYCHTFKNVPCRSHHDIEKCN